MAEKSAVMRLQKDFKRLLQDPVPYVSACPKPNNLLEWYYVVRGPEQTPYEGGYYLGRLIFPVEYPFKPPSIMILTPNGRFAPNQRLCLSMSDFHPESWNPAWNVGTILCGLVSFMTGSQSTVGSINTTETEKRVFARASIPWNLNNDTFRKLFPDFVPELEKKHREAVLPAESSPNESVPNVPDSNAAKQTGPEPNNNPANDARRNRHAISGKWLRILVVAGLAAFAVAVRAFSHSFSS
ncbi:ubiquitin-conjugating enzyme E2 J2-like [Paramacrobiotus metropolitanus]|uniref:ubiquitin-conjugating enzyme E2 J2-like n=1 Tax=Paramacrobiotus metropolitanus TaxID=2943436 RepID=UPI0024461F2F|nr:ubiquitin-conjugating enzyme E2 J2-like [Paramacrobiotus metropolitanus]